MARRSGLSRLWWIAALLAIGGCVAHPTIDAGRIGAPESIAIVDIPDGRPQALIGVLVPHAPGPNQFHFSERSDPFFAVAGAAPAIPLAGAPVVPVISNPGLIGGLIESSAAQTQRRAAAFGAEIAKLYPDFDLRASFMKALRDELEARGVVVRMLAEGRAIAPRLRWPAADAAGNKYPSGLLDSAPAVDADIVLQVCPIAMYNSPGPLNTYTLSVTVGVALYNGRNKQFLGRQVLRYVPGNAPGYSRYDALLADLKQAAPLLRDGLVSLAPQVADLATGRPLKQ